MMRQKTRDICTADSCDIYSSTQYFKRMITDIGTTEISFLPCSIICSQLISVQQDLSQEMIKFEPFKCLATQQKTTFIFLLFPSPPTSFYCYLFFICLECARARAHTHTHTHTHTYIEKTRLDISFESSA